MSAELKSSHHADRREAVALPRVLATWKLSSVAPRRCVAGDHRLSSTAKAPSRPISLPTTLAFRGTEPPSHTTEPTSTAPDPTTPPRSTTESCTRAVGSTEDPSSQIWNAERHSSRGCDAL